MYANPLYHLTNLLEVFANIANVIIACVNLLLAGYIFVYQRSKDKRDANESQLQLDQNIRLRWFIELIIQPNIEDIDKFHEELHSIAQKFSDSEQIEEVYKELKSKTSLFRRRFVELIRKIDQRLYDKIVSDLDNLVDGIGDIIYGSEVLLDCSVVNQKVTEWYQNFIATIYQYKAESN